MAASKGSDFAIAGIVLALTGLLIPTPFPFKELGLDVSIGLNIGIILCVLAIILGIVAIVKAEKGLGIAAIILGCIPFLQAIIGMVDGAFNGLHWIVSLALFVLAIGFVIWLLFIKK